MINELETIQQVLSHPKDIPSFSSLHLVRTNEIVLTDIPGRHVPTPRIIAASMVSLLLRPPDPNGDIMQKALPISIEGASEDSVVGSEGKGP